MGEHETSGGLESAELTFERLEQELQNLPEVRAGENLWQNEMHEYDVYKHSVECAKEMKAVAGLGGLKGKDALTLLAASYLHDIGKPIVATEKRDKKTGEIVYKEQNKPYHNFDGHEKAGGEMVEKMDGDFFEKYGIDQKRVAALVRYHYEPMKGIKKLRKARDKKEFRDFFDELDAHLQSLDGAKKEEVLDMFLADKLGQGKAVKDLQELLDIRNAFVADGVERNRLLDKIFKAQRGTV